MATIQNNQYEADEITASGLNAENASWVNAPMIRECFMNLECKYAWEKEIVPGDDHVILCLEVVGVNKSLEFFRKLGSYIVDCGIGLSRGFHKPCPCGCI